MRVDCQQRRQLPLPLLALKYRRHAEALQIDYVSRTHPPSHHQTPLMLHVGSLNQQLKRMGEE